MFFWYNFFVTRDFFDILNIFGNKRFMDFMVYLNNNYNVINGRRCFYYVFFVSEGLKFYKLSVLKSIYV